ncbi:DNA mismatch repair protein MutS [Candidatus Peregrinibacteria bacterium]|nr:DNA mismatch repair protein MutS [Candidatus Peregrinibacteria bacterium]
MGKLTPMMEQYMGIKNEYNDSILMFRMGDFYEMFFEDAKIAAEILQIALTKRNKSNPDEIMCGVPYHSVNNYISKLTGAGKKVALCDQVTKPDGKGIVKRKVIRVITPGTTIDENILENKTNNYICAVTKIKDIYGFSYCDLSTGEFRVTEISNFKNLKAEFLRLNPAECIFPPKLVEEDGALKHFLNSSNSIYKFPFKMSANPKQLLLNAFELKSLNVFGIKDSSSALFSSSMLYDYLTDTQKTSLKHINKISTYSNSGFMAMDESLIRNLELFYSSENKKEGSLINVLDKTVTPMGGRKLKKWLIHPLLKKEKLNLRLNRVEIFKNDSSLLRNIRNELSEINDIERLLSRISLGAGNARELKAMQLSLEHIPKIKELIKGENLLGELNDKLDPLQNLTSLIDKAICEEAPATLRDGGMIKKGYNSELDELRGISSQGKDFIQNMKEREISRTGINNLKIKYNKVFGYYIEISKSNLNSVPEDYIRKQTLVNAERFITPELKEYEEKVLSAEDKIKELEYELFYDVRMKIIEEILAIQNNASAIASLDIFANFAFIAEKNNYVKPEIFEGKALQIVNGRHPVIEQISNDREFVPNSSEFNEDKNFLLITGPNMGGKSTYLRQIALIVLMAQIGAFVPAESAKIGIVDKIFTRIGAKDNLSRGESTFMVEMQEASYILNNATENSLIILDEIGRGTSTFDGLSIAWAITEYIHNEIGAKTLFATHYHELTDLIKKLKKAKNYCVAVKEYQNEGIVFLYKIIEGRTSKSYGIEVAKLAGLPMEIIARSRGVLELLENSSLISDKDESQPALFERNHKSTIASDNKIFKELQELDINNLTPLKALEKLQDLKNLTSTQSN